MLDDRGPAKKKFALMNLEYSRRDALEWFDYELTERLAGSTQEVPWGQDAWRCVREISERINDADDDMSRFAVECMMEIGRICLHVYARIVDDSTCRRSLNNLHNDGGAALDRDWMAKRGLGILEDLSLRLLEKEKASLQEIGGAVSSWVAMYCLKREFLMRGVGHRLDAAERARNQAEAGLWFLRGRDFLLAVRRRCINGRGDLRRQWVAPEDNVLLRVQLSAERDLDLRGRWRALFDDRGSDAAFRDLVMAVVEGFAGPDSDSGLDFVRLAQRHKDGERLIMVAALRRSRT